jgi:pimeloyl-ACP methyl ester carboxylesterase
VVAVVLLGLTAAAGAAPPDPSESTLSEPIFRGQVRLYSAGPQDAPAVVLVHGIGAQGARDWDGLTRALARDFRVLRFDLPGFGRSSQGNEPYTPENYTAFLRYLVLERLGTRPFHLVGHSMGGAIALRYAARYPQDVKALVIADVPGILHRLAYSRYLTHLGINFLPSLYRAQNDHLGNIMSNLLGLVEKAQPAPETIVANPKLRSSLLNADPAKIAGLALALEDFSRDIPRVQAPTLVLWGGRDTLAPLRNGRVLAANLPQAQLEVLEASGHTPMEDMPEAFNARVAGFLRAPRIERANDVLHGALVALGAARRNATCRGQRGLVFEGEYDRLVIERCRDVTLRRAQVRELRIVGSEVGIEDSRIGGADGGLSADDARVQITSSLIEGQVAVRLDAARLDIAGSRIVGLEAAIVTRRKSDLLFSVSRVQSPHFQGSLHELRTLTPEHPL